jgi:hypothetical protein
VRSGTRACALQSTWDDTGQLHVLASRRRQDRAYALLIDTRRAKRSLGDRRSAKDLTSLAIPFSLDHSQLMCSDAHGREAARETRRHSRVHVRGCVRARALKRRARYDSSGGPWDSWSERSDSVAAGRLYRVCAESSGDNDGMSDWSVSEELPSDAAFASAFRDLFRFPPRSFPVELERTSERASGIGRNRRASERASERKGGRFVRSKASDDAWTLSSGRRQYARDFIVVAYDKT